MDYVVAHRPAVKHNTPDAMSGYPFLGPKILTRLGMGNAVKQLLQIPPSYSRNVRTWFWAGQDTKRMLPHITDWCTNKYCPIQNAPKSALISKKWELSILVPMPDNATATVCMMMAGKRPWFFLIPTNLIHYVSQNVGGGFDKLLQ